MTLVYYEIFDSRAEAVRREQQFKSGKTRERTIQRLIEAFDQETCQGFNCVKPPLTEHSEVSGLVERNP